MTTAHDDDSRFFQEKKPQQETVQKRRRNIKATMLFSISAIYGLLLFGVLIIEMKLSSSLSLLALYAYGVIGGWGLLSLKEVFDEKEKSRKVLVEVLEKSQEARVITDPDGLPSYYNARFEQLVKNIGEPTLENFARLFEDTKQVQKLVEDLKLKASPAGSASAELHTTLRNKPVWFQITCQFIVDRPGYIHWRIDDISSRHQMERAIREEREKLIDFTDNAPVGFFSVNENGNFLFANDTLARLLGKDVRSLSRMQLHDFLIDVPEGVPPYQCFKDSEPHQHGEVLMKGAGDRVFKAAITHSITPQNDGHLITRSVVYDLTAEQKMQQALKESQDRFERLFDEAPVGICLIGTDGIISDSNMAFINTLNLPRHSIEGKPLFNFIADNDQQKVKDWIEKLSTDQQAAAFIEVTLKGKQNSVAQLYARRFRSGDSLALHFIDLTEQKNLEQQFTQSQKMQAVGQLAGGIAHDFNNLLTAMIGFCDLLLLRHKPGDPSFADIMQIKQNANRAANLVRQLLAFSRQQTLQARILDITDVLTELTHLLRRLIGANIDLRIAHGTDLGLIKVDQGQMEQVLINLVVNARDSMANGGKLEIRTENLSNKKPISLTGDDILPPGEWVTIAVEDTGTGIDPDVIPRIFEPFFSTKEIGAGTGLGLSTVHGIIHQTGGYISVDSVIGQGTTFRIYLPRHRANTSEENKDKEEKQAAADLTGSAKILLVEDEDAVRTFSSRALSNKGYEVADAASGEAALQLIKDKKIEPDLLVTDVMMPEMDGPALARQVKEMIPDIKIIFISGYAEDKFKEHLGADVWFLPKPFTLKQLATKVKDVLDE